MNQRSSLLARAVAFLGLLSILAVVVLRGQPYIYCTFDHLLHFTTCCQTAHWEDGQAFDEPVCCENQPRADLASAAIPTPLLLSFGVASLPPSFDPLPTFVLLRWVAAPVAPHAIRPPARAPPPLSTARRLARLSRLLT